MLTCERMRMFKLLINKSKVMIKQFIHDILKGIQLEKKLLDVLEKQ